MPTHFLSLFKLPVKVSNTLEKLVRDFFWEGSRGDEGMYNVNWETTQLPKLLGGVGIGNFQQCKLSLLAKRIWRSLTEVHYGTH